MDWRLRRCLDDESETASSIAASDKSTRASMASSHLKRTLGDDDLDDEEDVDDMDSCAPPENDDVDVVYDDEIIPMHLRNVHHHQHHQQQQQHNHHDRHHIHFHHYTETAGQACHRSDRANRIFPVDSHPIDISHDFDVSIDNGPEITHVHAIHSDTCASAQTRNNNNENDNDIDPDEQYLSMDMLSLQSGKNTCSSRMFRHRRSSSASPLSTSSSAQFPSPPPLHFARSSTSSSQAFVSCTDNQSLSSEGFAATALSPSMDEISSNHIVDDANSQHPRSGDADYVSETDAQQRHQQRYTEKALRALFVRELLLNSVGLDSPYR